MVQKLKIVTTDDGCEIVANREGLIGLAEVCRALAMLPENDQEARQLGNHYHYAPWINNAEEDSVALTILYKPDL